MILDAHCHFYNKKNIVFLNSVTPKYWEQSINISQKNNNIFSFIGIHPWDVNATSDNQVNTLINLSQKTNTHHGIGEIGLDKVKNNENIKQQIKIFKQLFDYANQNELPVSIHCVKAWGLLLENLPQCVSTNVMIHGFNGSKETLKILLKKNIYVSINPLALSSDKIKNYMKVYDMNLFLLESDATQKNKENNKIEKAYKIFAEITNMQINDLERIVLKNGSIFTNKNFTGQ